MPSKVEPARKDSAAYGQQRDGPPYGLAQQPARLLPCFKPAPLDLRGLQGSQLFTVRRDATHYKARTVTAPDNLIHPPRDLDRVSRGVEQVVAQPLCLKRSRAEADGKGRGEQREPARQTAATKQQRCNPNCPHH